MHAIWQICQFELTRLFLTKRGGILLVAFAVIWLIIFKYPILEAAKIVNNPSFGENLSGFSKTLNLQHLLDWNYSELAIYWIFAVFAFPISAILMSSDQLASDTNRGTLRFILLRCSRNQLLFGRFLGQLLILTSLIMTTLTTAFIMGIIREPSLVSGAIADYIFVAFHLLLIGLPFIAVTSLLNIVLKSSKLSVVMIIIIAPIFHAIISYLSSLAGPIEHLLLLLPGIQLVDMLQMPSYELSVVLMTPIIQTVIYLLLAQQILSRRAL